jgi:hypothetical protein
MAGLRRQICTNPQRSVNKYRRHRAARAVATTEEMKWMPLDDPMPLKTVRNRWLSQKF